MNILRLTAPVLSFALLSGAAIAQAQYQGAPPPPPGYAQNPGSWETPPPQFAAAQQRGYRDGVEGARKDFENHRPPNVNNRDEYRHPNFIPRPDRRDYRYGFRQGYDAAVRQMYGPRPRY